MAIPERPLKPVSGGSGSAGQAAVATMPRAVAQQGPIARLLEDERVLGVMLLLPTIVLLALFIAYPVRQGGLALAHQRHRGQPRASSSP